MYTYGQALSHANTEQRKTLEENYGQHDAKKVEIVKKVFNIYMYMYKYVCLYTYN
jgi:hypothetical protein